MARTRRRDASTGDLERHNPAPDAFQQRIDELVALHAPVDGLNPRVVGRIAAAVLIQGLADADDQELSVGVRTGESSQLRDAVERSVSAVIERVLARDMSDPSAVAAQIVETCFGTEPVPSLDKGELLWIVATAYSVALELKTRHPGISERIVRAPFENADPEEAGAEKAPVEPEEARAEKAPVELDAGDVSRMITWADATTVGFLVNGAFRGLSLLGLIDNFAWLGLATLAVAAIPFLIWFRLAFIAAQKLSPELFEGLGSIWAVTAWLVPLLSFVFPFVIAKRIWKAFAMNAQLPPEPPAFFNGWWGFWVFGSLGVRFYPIPSQLVLLGACVLGIGFVRSANAMISLPLPHDGDGPLLPTNA